MAAKNLISVNQIRQDELFTYIDYVIESIPLDTGVSSLTGLIGSKKMLSLVSQPLLSGVTQITVSFPPQLTIPTVNIQLNTSGVSDPLILPNVSSKSLNNCVIDFSDKTYSNKYYFDLLLSV